MQTTDDILFSAHGPDPIPTATTEIVGTPGNARNVYWIVSHFPIGSVVSGPFSQKDSPNVLDDENYVHISWLPTLGALTYDLLFTRRLELPKQPGNFALALNLTDTEFRDTGQSLSEYDLAGIRYGAPQQEWIFFDNRDRQQPTLRFIPWPIEVSSIIFEDGSSLSTAGAAGGAAPPNQSVQFNNNGAFGGSSNLIWDGERLDVNALVRVSNRFVSTSGFGVEIGYDTVTHWGGIENFNYDTNAYEPMYMNGNPVLLNHPAADGSIPGNVGIGTNNPGYNLEVVGQAADPIPSTIGDAIFAIRTNTGISLRCGGTLTWPYDPWVQGEGTSGSISLNPLRGGVVIGGRDYTGTQSKLIVTVPANGPQNVATFASFEETRVWFGGWAGIGAPQGQMTFMTSGPNFGAWVERMRIDGIGNVGIGTQNPQATLDVAGNISLSGDINSIISHPTTAADLYFNAGRDIWVNARQIVLNNTNFLVAGSSTLNFNSSGSLTGTLGTVSLVTTGGMLFDSQDIIIFRVPSGLEVMRIQGSGILVQGDINLTGRLLINGVQVLP